MGFGVRNLHVKEIKLCNLNPIVVEENLFSIGVEIERRSCVAL